MVLRMTASPARGGGGAVELDGVVRDPAIVVRMESDVRDAFHDVRSRRLQERGREKSLAWHFETSIHVAPRGKEQYVSHLPEAPSGDAAAE